MVVDRSSDFPGLSLAMVLPDAGGGVGVGQPPAQPLDDIGASAGSDFSQVGESVLGWCEVDSSGVVQLGVVGPNGDDALQPISLPAPDGLLGTIKQLLQLYSADCRAFSIHKPRRIYHRFPSLQATRR